MIFVRALLVIGLARGISVRTEEVSAEGVTAALVRTSAAVESAVETQAAGENHEAQAAEENQEAQVAGEAHESADGKPERSRCRGSLCSRISRAAKGLAVGALMLSAPHTAAAAATPSLLASDGVQLSQGDRVRWLGTNQVGTIGRLCADNGCTGDVRFDSDPAWMRAHATNVYKWEDQDSHRWLDPRTLTHDLSGAAYVEPHHGQDADGVHFKLGDRVRLLPSNRVGTIGKLYSDSGDSGDLRVDLDQDWHRKYATAPYKYDTGNMWIRPRDMTHDVGTAAEHPFVPPHQGYDVDGRPFELWDKVRSKKFPERTGEITKLFSDSGDTGEMRVTWDKSGNYDFFWARPDQITHVE